MIRIASALLSVAVSPFAAAAQQFPTLEPPAPIGFFLRDEPHAALMPGLARVAKIARDAMPGMWPYVNLFPYRVSPERLGTDTYDKYVRMLVDTIGQPFLSYDNYSLVGGQMLDYFYTNLEIVRRLSIETQTPF